MVALADFFEGLHKIEQAVVLVSTTAHANEGHYLQAQRLVVDFDGVAVQDSGLFHLLEAFSGRCRREANATAQLSQAKACVDLQLVENLSSVGIK